MSGLSSKNHKTFAQLESEVDAAIDALKAAKSAKQREARAEAAKSALSELRSRLEDAEAWLASSMEEDGGDADRVWMIVLERYMRAADAEKRGLACLNGA